MIMGNIDKELPPLNIYLVAKREFPENSSIKFAFTLYIPGDSTADLR